MSIEAKKITGEEIYTDDSGFLHDAKAENITIGDCIRAMNDEQLADLYVAATESAMKVVLGKHGITYEKANLDKEELKKLMLDMLKKNASDLGKAEKERNF